MRLRLDIAYDGTAFRGWARQPGLRTVQGALEAAIARILGGDQSDTRRQIEVISSRSVGRWTFATSVQPGAGVGAGA